MNIWNGIIRSIIALRLMLEIFARSLHHLQLFIAKLMSQANALTPMLKKVLLRIMCHCQLSLLLSHWSYGKKRNANQCNWGDVRMPAWQGRLSLQNVCMYRQNSNGTRFIFSDEDVCYPKVFIFWGDSYFLGLIYWSIEWTLRNFGNI